MTKTSKKYITITVAITTEDGFNRCIYRGEVSLDELGKVSNPRQALTASFKKLAQAALDDIKADINL